MSIRAPRIGVIDYGMGNRRSVQKALERVGAVAAISHDHSELLEADGLVLPGVGAFPLAMRNLRSLGLDELIKRRIDEGTRLLGICLGMQLLFDTSDELQGAEGLGLLGGAVTELKTAGLRVPHIGWNEVRFERPSRLTDELPGSGCAFYHVHSYAARPSDPADVVGTTDYGERFATIVERDTVAGVQFHPEKSSAHGLRLLANFASLCGIGEVPARAAAPSRA